MSDENKILNRGLDALLGSNIKTTQKTVKEVSTNNISAGRFQPRSNFDEGKLLELTESIKNHGVISPILVREVGLNQYEVIAGERRLRASKKAGLETIPCLVDQKKDQDALESALIENLQREDLNAVEEARGYDRLKREFGLTQDEVASSSKIIGLFLIIALAIETLCFSPPDNLVPFSPIIVSYLSGNLLMNSSAKANFAASSISFKEAFGFA